MLSSFNKRLEWSLYTFLPYWMENFPNFCGKKCPDGTTLSNFFIPEKWWKQHDYDCWICFCVLFY